jgi:hypothetical protein
MMAMYELILIFSTLFCSWAIGRVALFLLHELGMKTKYAQLATILSMLVFLMVVSVPAGLLIGAFLMLVTGIVTPGARSNFSIIILLPLLIAASLALIGLRESPGSWPEILPPLVIEMWAWIVFAACVLIARSVQVRTAQFNAWTVFSILPLALGPVLYPRAHDSLALDAAIICAALAGGMRTVKGDMNATAFVRLPVALMVGYGIMQALRYDAWPLAAVSMVIWLGGLLLSSRRDAYVPA